MLVSEKEHNGHRIVQL
jgi:hypothetical protein